MRETPRRRRWILRVAALAVAAAQLGLPLAADARGEDALEERAASFRSSAEGLPGFAREAWETAVLLEIRAWRTGGVRETSAGSGVVLDLDPRDRTLLVGTSSHVVACAAACVIRVVFPGQGARGRRVAAFARLLWSDPRQDLALLEATAPERAVFGIARPAERSSLGAGSRVAAIGFPGPEGRSAGRARRYSEGRLLDAAGTLRADYRAYGSPAASGRLELDAAWIHSAELLPGSSGGPLIDSRGMVIGINTGSLMLADGTDCVRRPTGGEPRCVHLAVALAPLLEKLRELGRAQGDARVVPAK